MAKKSSSIRNIVCRGRPKALRCLYLPTSAVAHADRDWNHQTKEEAFPKEDKPPPEANFALSGKLAEESNTVNGVVLLHVEPPEARRPSVRWRLYIFKSGALALL